MSRLCRVSGLSLLLIAVFGSLPASATPLTSDPIVRTRGGGGSLPFFSLPFTFNFGAFPDESGEPAPPSNCSFGPDSFHPELNAVSCDFQNLTNQTISLLKFTFGIPGDTSTLDFNTEDPDERWGGGSDRTINEFGARFTGGLGLVSGTCAGDDCTGGHFSVDIVGFPAGSTIEMTADVAAVPEPATLFLLGTGLAFATGRARRRARR
jgi:hypothetical protein